MQESGIRAFTRHIIELLYRHDKLVVPGLGAFICTEIPARIHPVTHEIHPPSKELSFDPNQQDDDGVLLAYLTKKLPARKEAARKLLQQSVDEFRASLKDQAQMLPGLGSFRLLSHGEMEFIPDPDINLLESSTGLRPVQARPVLRNAAPPDPKPVSPDTEPIVQTAVEIEVATDEPETAAVTDVPRSKKAYYSIIVFLLPIIGFSVLGFLYHKEAIWTGRMIMKAWQDRIPAVETVPVSPETQETAESSTALLPDSILEESITDTIPRYFIVAGCFKSEHNASNLVNELKAKGYVASIQGRTPQGLLRVCYQGFADTIQANTLLQQIMARENPTAWLLDIQAEKSE